MAVIPRAAADPTYRPPTQQLLELRYSPGVAFRFAIPQQQFLDFSGPGGTEVKIGRLQNSCRQYDDHEAQYKSFLPAHHPAH